jgi:hypothetical protein
MGLWLPYWDDEVVFLCLFRHGELEAVEQPVRVLVYMPNTSPFYSNDSLVLKHNDGVGISDSSL